MKILITGGAGFIGSNLANYHLGKNDQVFVVDNFLTGSKKNIEAFKNNKNFYFFEADVCSFNFSSLPKFDVVYHLASPASPIQYKKYSEETLLTNSLGTYKVLNFVKESCSDIFVLASTSEVYGDPQVHPQTENYFGNVNTVGERSCYDEGKRFAETLTINFFKKYKIDVRIARIFNTYGPNMEKKDGRVVSNFIIQALEKKPLTIYGRGNQTRSFCFVSDMVTGLYSLASIKNLAGEVINLGNSNEMTIIELARIIKNLTATKSEIVFYPACDADDPQRRRPDINKAKSLLNWQPKIPLIPGLKKTIQYFQNRFL